MKKIYLTEEERKAAQRRAAAKYYAKNPRGRVLRNYAWRRANPDKWNREKARNYSKGYNHLTLGERAGKRFWSEEHDTLVLAHATSDRELALKIRRSVKAIQIRRSRLKAAA